MQELAKAFSPQENEDKLYDLWERAGAFAPEAAYSLWQMANSKGRDANSKSLIADSQNPTTISHQPSAISHKPSAISHMPSAISDERFSLVLPPPNVTGTLHMGHAFEYAIQDATVRFARMNGKKTVWIPGTDHAAIATQSRFEKELYKKEKKSRHDFSRADFFKLVQNFALENQASILNQLKKLGLSLDWSRLAFTLDDQRAGAVAEAFKQMFEAGLIYQDYKVVNWDPKGQTTVSDDEVVHEAAQANLYTFRYAANFPIPIATTRPETKVGDTGVAVNPKDDRWAKYIGKEYNDIDFCGVKLNIKIIGDESVDPQFGTGAVGVTPAHSLVDWELAQKHGLELKPAINEYARMTVEGELNGKKTLEARELIVSWLKENQLMEKEEVIQNNLSKADRTGGTIEPLPKKQWFVDVNKKFKLKDPKITGFLAGHEVSLKQLMKQVVKNDQVKITPARFEKVYFNWIDNLRDWCISRQIIYGHQIPVWYCDCGHKFVSGSKSGVKVIFMRHGQAEHNVREIGNGDPGKAYHLTEQGKTQVANAVESLKQRGIRLDDIYASEMPRVQETAKIATQELGGEITTDARLNDIGLGNLESRPTTEIIELTDMHTKSVEGSETFTEIKKRFNDFVKDLKASDKEPKTILVVMSEVLFWALQSSVSEDLGIEHAPGGMPNAGIRELELDQFETCLNCGLMTGNRDTDTLDTWFSSGLWSFSTLGWPNKTSELSEFHPNSVMMPGYEILFFWVARMILMSGFLLEEVPFKQVFLHGIVRDSQGKKFSKSLGNGIDPLEITSKYGTDALRMALLFNTAPGGDIVYSEDKVRGMRNFANKVWNVGRFVITNLEESRISNYELRIKPSTEADRKIIEQLDHTTQFVTKNLETFQFHEAAQKIYDFIWHDLADIYLEESKKQMDDENLKDSTLNILHHSLVTSLKLLHPFMPFVTEALWQELKERELVEVPMLITAKFPRVVE